MALTSPDRVALDTSAWSWLRAGHVDVLDALAAARVVLVPTVVVGELCAAFRRGSRSKENELALDRFLGEPFVVLAPVSLDVARVYGELLAELRRAGTPIPTNDVWIAATAREAGAHLVTYDTDFTRISGLSHTLLQPPRTSP